MSPEEYQVLLRIANTLDDIYQLLKQNAPVREAIAYNPDDIPFKRKDFENIDTSKLKNRPNIRKLASMPDDEYQLFKQADPVRAALVDMCREIVGMTEKNA